jgi:hypothetical protein
MEHGDLAVVLFGREEFGRWMNRAFLTESRVFGAAMAFLGLQAFNDRAERLVRFRAALDRRSENASRKPRHLRRK